MEFKDFFGIQKQEIKEDCIICQLYDLPLFAKKSEIGFFVKTAEAENATIIGLKNNFLAGDAVLHLRNSSCKKIYLFGNCGGCADVESGDILMIDKAYNFESFSKMAAHDTNPDFFTSSKELLEDFYSNNHYEDLIKTNSACVSSLLLEAEYIDWFKNNGICAIDMESSIVFSAAKKIGVKAVCFMYVADHIEKSPIGFELDEKTRKAVSCARRKLPRMILDFINGR
ncbi:MAG: hypothetical protein LBD46_06405 [Endomicrobium sp.]|jgi:nucleoside phosphorylase|nr:hypothetical protein [Endomicrobium sp.]